MDDLRGRVAVVTGAASGMGRAVARRFAAEGALLVIADIDGAALTAVADELTASGRDDVLALEMDVARVDDWERLRAETLARYGAVHVAHLNAGVVAAGPVDDLALEVWEWVIGVDLWGVIHGVRTLLPLMRNAGEGHLVATASTCGIQSAMAIGPYNVAKFGVVAMMETVRRELESSGSPVSASVLVPGAVNTRIVESDRSMPPSVREAHKPSEMEVIFRDHAGPLLRDHGLDPDDVASMVLDAIYTNRFWIVTHPGWFDVAEQRATAMRAGHLAGGFGG